MADALDYNRNFASKIVANTADDIFTLPAGVLRNLIITLSNTSASPVTISGWLIPASGSAANGNKFIPGESVGANATIDIAVPKMIAGDKLTLQAGTAAVLAVFRLYVSRDLVVNRVLKYPFKNVPRCLCRIISAIAVQETGMYA